VKLVDLLRDWTPPLIQRAVQARVPKVLGPLRELSPETFETFAVAKTGQIFCRSCNFCGSETFRVFKRLPSPFPPRIYGNHDLTFPNVGEQLRLQYLECAQCGLVGINPLTRFSDIDKHSFEHEKNIVAWAECDYRFYETDKVSSFEFLYERHGFEALRKTNRVLDVSCGPGVALRWLRDEHGWEVSGVDPDLHSVKTAAERYGLKIQNGLLSEVDVPDGYFDLIIMDNSLEHTIDPLRTLLLAYRKLRPGGGLFINVPNSEGWSSIHLNANAYWGHWFFYCPRSLIRVLVKIGFEPSRLLALQENLNAELKKAGIDVPYSKHELMVDVTGASEVLRRVDAGPCRADYFSVTALKPVEDGGWLRRLGTTMQLATVSAASMRERESVTLVS